VDPRAPCHFELHTRDYDATVAFYEKVFGWKPEPVSDTPEFRYTVLNVADGENAGIMDSSGFLPEGVPAHWSVYFAVEDVDKALATVETLGGTIVLAAEDTPYGRIASAADSTGATFKLRADC
jgi:predicted enzyme related to lactoylglutathione lyase